MHQFQSNNGGHIRGRQWEWRTLKSFEKLLFSEQEIENKTDEIAEK